MQGVSCLGATRSFVSSWLLGRSGARSRDKNRVPARKRISAETGTLVRLPPDLMTD